MKIFLKSYTIGNKGQKVVFLCQGHNENYSYGSEQDAQEACDRSNKLFEDSAKEHGMSAPEWVYFTSDNDRPEL